MNIFLQLLSLVLFLGASGMIYMSGELFLKAIRMSGPDNMGYFLSMMFFVPGICLLLVSIAVFRLSKIKR